MFSRISSYSNYLFEGGFVKELGSILQKIISISIRSGNSCFGLGMIGIKCYVMWLEDRKRASGWFLYHD